MTQDVLEIFIDGACKGHPGIGGWGVLMRFGRHEKVLKGGEWQTTNNRMELLAAIEALQAIKLPCRIHLTTDSYYVKNGVTDWLAKWKRNDWKTAQKKAVKNVELWRRLDFLSAQFDIEWHWVKGHSGHPGNEMADRLANEAIDELREGVQSRRNRAACILPAFSLDLTKANLDVLSMATNRRNFPGALLT